MFQVIIVALYALGFALSATFVLTWTPLAIKARLRHVPSATWPRISDYMGFEVSIFVVFGFLLWSFTSREIPDPASLSGALGRIGLPATLDIFLALRLAKWMRQWRGGKNGTSSTDPFEGLSRGGDE